MTPYWVSFTDGSGACVEADDPSSARVIAQQQGGGRVVSQATVERLPYPAEPRLGPQSSCPSFCWKPRQCAGYSSCPDLRRTCSE